VPLPSCTSRQLKGNIPLALRHLSSEQAREVVRHAVQSLVALAERYQVVIAIEDLDFAKKKADMGDQGARYNRMLSSLNTAGFADALRSRCQKKGIPLHKVNPAWTSIAGWAKYGMRNSLSIDQAAAFAIARKALLGKLNEKPLPTHIQTGRKAGQKLSPKFVRALRVKREAQVVSYHESVRFSQPSPAFHKMMARSHKGVSWSSVSKVLGANRKYWKRPWSLPINDSHSKAVADPVVACQRPPRRLHKKFLGPSWATREMSNESPSPQVTAVLG
jgi:IS605 OrfB family transposase